MHQLILATLLIAPMTKPGSITPDPLPDSKHVLLQEASVQLKTQQANEEQQLINEWNRWYIIFLIITVVAGVGSVVKTREILKKTNKLSKIEGDISKLKESINENLRQAFLLDLSNKGEKIALAQESAAQANGKQKQNSSNEKNLKLK